MNSVPYIKQGRVIDKKMTSLPTKLKSIPITFKNKSPVKKSNTFKNKSLVKKSGASSVPYIKQERVIDKKMTSLPTKLKGSAVSFKKPPIDEIFWSKYKDGMDIHNYVEKRIVELKLVMDDKISPKGELCKLSKKQLKLFKYQTVQTILGSPFSPLRRLLIIASTGTGKTCTMVGIVNHHIRYNIKHHKKQGIIFIGATHELFTNFIKQSMECPGDMKEIAESHNWVDSNDVNHVSSFAKYIKQYVYPLNYTEFGNLISGKYKKYEKITSLRDKLIIMDEVHYIVDSIDKTSLKPSYERMSPNWRDNLREMYNLLSIPNNPTISGSTIVGATATPITQSILEYFSLVNIFANTPLTSEKLNSLLKQIYQIEQSGEFGETQYNQIQSCMKVFEPIIKETVAMYIAKKSNKVLDTSIFPQMIFETIHIPLTKSQSEAIYSKI
jgi:hypothetical protein